jgi:hypothetical protein
MQSQVSSLEENKTWEPSCLPPGRKAIPIKWVFRSETDAEEMVCQYKAILVCLLRLKGRTNSCLTAFLNPDIEEEIYIQVPQGLETPDEVKK